MKYATWKVSFKNSTTEGTSPDPVVSEQGQYIEGILVLDNFITAGYTSDDINVSELEEWDFTEITQDQFLSLAINENPKATLDSDGKVDFHTPPLQEYK